MLPKGSLRPGRPPETRHDKLTADSALPLPGPASLWTQPTVERPCAHKS